MIFWRSLLVAGLLLVGSAFSAHAQNPACKQSGQVTPGHIATWTTDCVLQDGGTPANPQITGGVGVASGNQQSICTQNSKTGAVSQICLGSPATGGFLDFETLGGGPSLPFKLRINGVDYTFPFPSTPINLPFLAATTFGVVADGVTSDDAAMRNAVAACATAGTALMLPPGRILLSSSTPIIFGNCAMFGVGSPAGNSGAGNKYGTTFLLTSTAVSPGVFVLTGNGRMSGINFYQPSQTGASVYPPVLTDAGNVSVAFMYFDHIGVVNVYDFAVQGSTSNWVTWNWSDSFMYAAHDLFRLAQTSDSWRMSNIHFTHAMWASIVGYPTVAAYLNTADMNNTIIHVTAGGNVQINIVNGTSFAWRYGIRTDNGGLFGGNYVEGAFDGIGTFLDTSAGGCASGTTFTGSNWFGYIPVFSTSGSVSGTGNAPMFNLGSGAGNCHGPIINGLQASQPTVGDFIDSTGQEITVSNSVIAFGNANDGNDYYGIHLSAGGGAHPLLIANNNIFVGGASPSAKLHGIKSDVATTFIASLNFMSGLHDGANITLSAATAQFQNNQILSTSGTSSILTSGTGTLSASGNIVDKPTPPAISACGTGAHTGPFGGSGGAGPTSGVITAGTSTTSCVLTFPWAPYGESSCTFTARTPVWLSAAKAGSAGAPPVWTIQGYTASGTLTDLGGLEIFYNCPGLG
jgi:hypothetical protein